MSVRKLFSFILILAFVSGCSKSNVDSDLHPASVSVNKTSLTLVKGTSERLTATISPDNATNKGHTWQSSATTVATIDETGNVTAVDLGTATITVTTLDGKKTATCNVTVVDQIIAVTSVSLDKATATIEKNQTLELSATVLPSTATDKTVTWKSSDNTIATVDKDGKITGVSEGKATITATTNNDGKSANCALTVTKESVLTVITRDATDITSNSAITGGNITSDGGNPVTARGVCWSTSANPTIAGSKTTDGTGTGEYTSNITGLQVNTKYYYRAYATNSKGTVYGEEKNFTTPLLTAPTVETHRVEDINIDKGSVFCEVTVPGSDPVTERGICWSLNPDPTVADNKIASGSGDGQYLVTITGLQKNQKVYVKAYATNKVGTSYGQQLDFTTIENNIIYVSKTTGNDDNSGFGWDRAKSSITAAFEIAKSGFEIWVDDATYDEGVIMKDGVNIYGGFKGTETDKNQRIADTRTTLLRKNIYQVRDFTVETVADGFEVSSYTTSDAVKILKNGVISNSVVTGCTGGNAVNITGGKAIDCKFSNNTTGSPFINISDGGILRYCTISDNDVYNNLIYNNTSLIQNCRIENNTQSSGSSAVTNKVFISGTNAKIEGCLISGNQGYYSFRIIYVTDVKINNCTLVNNKRFTNDGSPALISSSGNTDLTNSVIYGNTSTISWFIGSTTNLFMSNCALEVNTTLGKNMILLLVDNPPNFDTGYTLKSNSPLVNKGDNSLGSSGYTKDLNKNARIQKGTIDIGAFESSY